MDFSLPYKVSYSDGESKCKKCRKEIRSGEIRIAIMMQSDEEDCHCPVWYHQPCFFQTRLPSTEAGFDGFTLLRYKDQMAIREDLGLLEAEDESETESQAKAEPEMDVTAIPDFGIEYARSDRDKCEGCIQQIKQSEVRIMKFVRDENEIRWIGCTSYDGKATWYHVLCFARLRSELNWWESGEMLPGFKRLREEDKDSVKEHIPLMRRDATVEKRPNIDMVALEKQIKIQNEEYFNVYDLLVKNVLKEDQIEILRLNAQLVPEDADEILHRLTDVIYFGAPKYCTKCGMGHLVFHNTTYICTNSDKIGWTKCDNQVNEPSRIPRLIPTHLLAKYPFLTPFVNPFETRKRAIHCFRTTDESGNDLVHGPYKKPPLFNMAFVIIGSLIMTKKEIERTIKKMGGKVGHRIHDKLAAIISTQEEVQKMDQLMKQAKECNIQVVSENFLKEIIDTDPILYIISRSICEWGGDPYERIEDNDVSTRRDTMFYTKSLPEKVTYKWKDGTAVDPDCGLDENAHVYCGKVYLKNMKYSVILGLVDIQSNKNSYYRMQLLESNEIKLYWVFESWGRISTVIGNKRLTNYGTLKEACEKFHAVYKEKTGNLFGDYIFCKKPNKFYHLDVEFDMPKKIANALIKTSLSKPVYQLMELLFDTKQMENAMLSCDLDLKQMPLGKISQTQIHLAMSTLKEISTLIQHRSSLSQLQDASNKFYTLIPHAFGIERPPIIDSIGVVNAKNEMLESLLNMELIYSFLNEESGEKSNPLDACYQKLKAEIIPLKKDSDEYSYLCDIVRNTHGSTHNTYKLEVLEIFKIVREGEADRFNAIEKQHKQKKNVLLWHGSRLTNFVSILTNGLKVAPPEAPHTGYMFGKGIYFADAVSKSANYCFAMGNNDVGLMLMCEVALGQMKNLNFAQNIHNIPNKTYQSVKGNGLLVTEDWRMIDGLPAAYGQLQLKNLQTALQYNEYIVYNPAQVKLKYLFKMKFNYGR